MDRTTRIAITIVLAFVILAGGFLVLRKVPSAQTPVPVATSTVSSTTATFTTNPSAGRNAPIINQPAGGTTVHLSATSVRAPDFRKPLIYPTSMSAETQAAINSHFTADVAALSKDPRDINAWSDLGVLRKMVQDYQGSADIWRYLIQIYPQNTGPLSSLGDIEANYLHDYPLAEAAYLRVVALEPTSADPYRELFLLYSGPYKKSPTAAEDILKQGIAASPKAYDLQVLLARFYADAGRIAEARAAYDAAAANATAQGLNDIAAQIKQDEAALK